MVFDLKVFTKGLQKTFEKTNPDIVFDPTKEFERVTSGSIMADLVLGGGFPKGRISEIFGFEHSGKTSLLLSTFAAAQRQGQVSLFLDFEQAYDQVYAESVFGLRQDGETFIVYHPSCIEDGDVIMDALIKAKMAPDIIAFDSAAAMQPREVLQQSLEENRRVGAHPQALGRFVTKVRGYAATYNVAAIFTNQIRALIRGYSPMDIAKSGQGQGVGSGFNPMESWTTPGGMSLRFYSSIRMKLEYGGKVEVDDFVDPVTGQIGGKVRVANLIKFINVKNKCYPPFLKSESRFNFFLPGIDCPGWDNVQDIINVLKKRGHITQSGTKFVYHGIKVPEWGNTGKIVDTVKKFRNNLELVEDARDLVLSLARDNIMNAVQVASLSEMSQEVDKKEYVLSMKSIDVESEEEELVDESLNPKSEDSI
jgi:recombination protein RecA